MNHLLINGLYVITAETSGHNHDVVSRAELAIDGGASIVQYRNKLADPESRIREAVALAKLCRGRKIPFLVNDDLELARVAGADGVHLGQDDATLREARSLLGSDTIIGISCYDCLDLAQRAEADGADYIAFGSFFQSTTKPDAARATLELLQRAREELDIPIVAIGGITPENGRHLIDAGAHSLAVINGVFGQADILAAAQNYVRLFARVEQKCRLEFQ